MNEYEQTVHFNPEARKVFDALVTEQPSPLHPHDVVYHWKWFLEGWKKGQNQDGRVPPKTPFSAGELLNSVNLRGVS